MCNREPGSGCVSFDVEMHGIARSARLSGSDILHHEEERCRQEAGLGWQWQCQYGFGGPGKDEI